MSDEGTTGVTAASDEGATGVTAASGGPPEASGSHGELHPGVDAPVAAGVRPAPASLVRMANQIASNAAHKPHDVAVERTAVHLREFWHPSMIRDLQAWAADGGEGLTEVAAEALSTLR